MSEIENAIATTLQDLGFVVKAFDKTAILTLGKVVGNFILPGIPQLQKLAETM